MYYGEYTFDTITFYIVKEGNAVLFVSNVKEDFEKRYPGLERNDAHCTDVIQQLDEYFHSKRKHFELELKPEGTAFQHDVWHALKAIPFGNVVTYSDIAQSVGGVNKVRAAASAIGKNPLMILVPCHRVIGKDGGMHGFAGGLDLKKHLLELEQSQWT